MNGLEYSVETAAVDGLVAMEGKAEAFQLEDGPDGGLGVTWIHGIGLVVEGVLVGPEDFAVGLGDPEPVVECAEDGVRVLGGDSFGTGEDPGLEFGGEGVDFGVKAVDAGVLGDFVLTFRRARTRGLQRIGAVGGEAAFRDLGQGHGGDSPALRMAGRVQDPWCGEDQVIEKKANGGRKKLSPTCEPTPRGGPFGLMRNHSASPRQPIDGPRRIHRQT